MNTVFGYARVSTQDQDLEQQIHALKNYHPEIRIFSEKVSTRKNQMELNSLFSILNSGDTLVVTDLTRLSRGLLSLVKWVDLMKEKNVNFVCINQKIDTTTTEGKFIFYVFALLSEFERDVIRDRTKRSLYERKTRGLNGGRKSMISDPLKKDKMNHAIKDYIEKKEALKVVLSRYSLKKTSFYKYLRMYNNGKNLDDKG